MYIENINKIIDGCSLDISNHNFLESCEETLKINNSINEITLTSNSIPCNIGISVEERTTDLILKINNLSINSNNIAFDLTNGTFCNYKIFLIFSGENIIASSDNIAICINNNHTIEFCGSKNSSLRIIAGNNHPALGNTPSYAGNAHIIFSGTGNIDIYGGNNSLNPALQNPNIFSQSAGINIIHKNTDEISSLSIKDSINIKIKGGDSIPSIQMQPDTDPSCGSAGISVDYYTLIEKKSRGILDISGGNGQLGGPAILSNGSFIKILEPCILFSGHNNNADNMNYSYVILFISSSAIKNPQKNKLFITNNILINGELANAHSFNLIDSSELNNLLNLKKNHPQSLCQEIILNKSKNDPLIKKLLKKLYRRLHS